MVKNLTHGVRLMYDLFIVDMFASTKLFYFKIILTIFFISFNHKWNDRNQ